MNKKKQKKNNRKDRKIPQKTHNAQAADYEKESTFYIFRNEFFILLLMSLFIFLLYSNTLNYPFQFDDETTIIKNPNLHLTEITWKQISNIYNNYYGYRYVSHASFALNYYFNQQNTFGYHLFNIIVHIVNGILIFYLVKVTLILLRNKNQNSEISHSNFNPIVYIPLFSSLIWLVHPLQTNSVTYITQRMNSMAVMFYLLSMLLYIKGRILQIRIQFSSKQKTEKWQSETHNHYLYFAASATAGLLSVACKENSATLPFFLILYDLYFFQSFRSSCPKKLIGLLFIIIVFWAIIFQLYTLKWYFDLYYQGFSFTMLQRVLTEFRVVIYYISLFFFPHPDRLNFDYDFPLSYSLTAPITTLLSLCALIALITIALLFAKKERLLSFGILWFLGNLMIESSIIPLDIIFEHRTYLPSILLSVIFVATVWRYKGSAKFKIGLLSAFIVLLSYWTVQRNLIWRSSITLWKDCVKKSPEKDRPHANLGRSLEMAGRIDEALLEYKKTLTINPYHQLTLNNMGLILYKKGDLNEAINYYRKALRSDPDFTEAHNNIGVALIDQKKLEEGILHYKEALRLDPKHPEASGNLEKAIQGLQKINEKISKTQGILKQTPKDFNLYYKLGVLFYLKGHFDTSIQYYRKALSMKPDHVKSLNGLSSIHSIRKQYDAALSIARKVLELRPENPGAYYNIACIYSLQNNKKQAVVWLKKSVEKGFNKWELIKTDKDLMQIRDTEGYKNIIQNR